MLLQQSYRPNDPAGMAKTLTMVEELSHRVKLYRLGCNQEQEAAWVAYRGMSEGGKIQ
jgi:phospholipase C